MEMKKWIHKLFSNSKDVSVMRILTIFVVLDIILVWDYQCIKTASFVDMGVNNAGLLVGVLCAKALQSFGEKKEE